MAQRTVAMCDGKYIGMLPAIDGLSAICPECGSKLVEKNGRNGRFIGCSGYPKCRYTRSIR